MPQTLSIYTDGGCRGNPGLGSWAFAVYFGNTYRGQKSSAEAYTTNNKMEIKALLEALKWVEKQKFTLDSIVYIYSDSTYVQQGYKNWLGNWVKRNWRTASGTQVKNKDLWKEVSKYKNLLNSRVSVEKVKGHAGIVGNEKADELCNIRMDEFNKGTA